MTLPCPPNPAKAKQAAAARAAKEAKMKNPAAAGVTEVEETNKKKEDKPEKSVNRWYMGEYGTNDGECNTSGTAQWKQIRTVKLRRDNNSDFFISSTS